VALVACCNDWIARDTVCVVQEEPCPPSLTTIAIQTAPATSCQVGETPCVVESFLSCCTWACTGMADLCMSGANFSCCHGYCGEWLVENPDKSTMLVLNPACEPTPAHDVSACCSPHGIAVSPDLLTGPPEWAVSFGYTIEAPDAGPEASASPASVAAMPDAPRTSPPASPHTAAPCSLSATPSPRTGGPLPWGLAMVFGIARAWRRRR
jgi:hypothetical protein